MSNTRRGAMLVLVLASLALAAALIAPLATLSGIEAVEGGYHAATLRHRLAAESVLVVLPELLAQDSRVQRELDRTNRYYLTLALGDLHVDVLIQDDSAKLPMELFERTRHPEARRSALQTLQAAAGLPALDLAEAPHAGEGRRAADSLPWTGCLDDLFACPSDAVLFGTPRSPRTWTHCLTPAGHTVHAWRADAAVLEAALQDLSPGLGTQLVHRRAGRAKPDLDELLGALELPGDVRREVAARLTVRTERYSLLVRTRLGRDVRQRYLICDAADSTNVLVNWEVAP